MNRYREVEPELREDERVQALCRALVICTDEELMLKFLRDVLTIREARDISKRWAAARLLIQRQTQSQTAKDLEMSNRTVNEVDQWVHGPYATGGYWGVSRLLQGETENAPQQPAE